MGTWNTRGFYTNPIVWCFRHQTETQHSFDALDIRHAIMPSSWNATLGTSPVQELDQGNI